MGLDIMKGQSHPSINSINYQGLHRNHWNAKSVLDWADPRFSCRCLSNPVRDPIVCGRTVLCERELPLLSKALQGIVPPRQPQTKKKTKKKKTRAQPTVKISTSLHQTSQDGINVPAIAPSYIYVPSYFGTLDLKTQTLDSTLVSISCDLLLSPGKKQAFCFYFLVFTFFENPRNLAQLPFPLSKP